MSTFKALCRGTSCFKTIYLRYLVGRAITNIDVGRTFFSSISSRSSYGWDVEEGKFNSIHIKLKDEFSFGINFKSQFEACLCELEEYNKALKAVLCYVPMNHCHVCKDLVSLGFEVHHAKTGYILFSKWLIPGEDSKVPPYANHQVGVSGYVFDEKNKRTLVVQDKGKTKRWKFPGGFADHGESISETCVREVREETGVLTEFRSILTFREQHGMGFANLTDLYFICRLKPLTFDIKMCDEEIEKCEWIPTEELLDDRVATPLTKLVTRLMMKGVRQGYDTVDLVSSEMKAWVPPFRTFNVYHPIVDS